MSEYYKFRIGGEVFLGEGPIFQVLGNVSVDVSANKPWVKSGREHVLKGLDFVPSLVPSRRLVPSDYVSVVTSP